jgi:hypothetical protein
VAAGAGDPDRLALALQQTWMEDGPGRRGPMKVALYYILYYTPSIPNCKSFDFVCRKFDHPSCSKNWYKYNENSVLLRSEEGRLGKEV